MHTGFIAVLKIFSLTFGKTLMFFPDFLSEKIYNSLTLTKIKFTFPDYLPLAESIQSMVRKTIRIRITQILT